MGIEKSTNSNAIQSKATTFTVVPKTCPRFHLARSTWNDGKQSQQLPQTGRSVQLTSLLLQNKLMAIGIAYASARACTPTETKAKNAEELPKLINLSLRSASSHCSSRAEHLPN